MPVNPPPAWGNSYEPKFKEVFEEPAPKKEDFADEGAFNQASDDYTAGLSDKVAEAWKTWFFENAQGIQTIAPLAAPVPMFPTTNADDFGKDLDFSSTSTAPQVADMLASAFENWAKSLIWIPPPPAPPFLAITNVSTFAPSIQAAKAALTASLLSQMASPPPPSPEASLPVYLALGTAFYTACISLQVMFEGTAPGSPPPPLQIPVPAF